MSLRERLSGRKENSGIVSQYPAEIKEAQAMWNLAEREVSSLNPNKPVYLIFGDGEKPTHIVSARTTEQGNPSFTGVNVIAEYASPEEWAGMVGMAQARIAKREKTDPAEMTLFYPCACFPGDTLQNIFFIDVGYDPSNLKTPLSVEPIDDRSSPMGPNTARVNLVVV